MSRNIAYKDNRLTIVHDIDHICGEFYQIYDKQIETPEGEGLVLDWSELFKYQTNCTGIPNNKNIKELVKKYIKDSTCDNDE